MKNINKITPYIAIVAAMLIWAGAGIAVKEALVIFSPLTLIVMRFTLAVLLMLSIGLLFRHNSIVGLQRVERKDIPLFLLGGLFQPFLYFIFETYTYQSFSSPTVAEALLSTQPVMAPLFAWVLLRERVTRNNILGIVLSTLGVMMLLMMGGGPLAMGDGSIGKGVLLAVLTVSMSVSYSVVLRRIPTQYSPLSIVFYVQSFALVLFWAMWGISGIGDGILGDEAIRLLGDSAPQISAAISGTPTAIRLLGDSAMRLLGEGQWVKSLLSVGYLAVLASVTAFILFCYTVRQIGVTRANVFNNVRPVFTAILMWMIFGEILPIWKIIGIIIIIIGLFISQKQEKGSKN
jgi:drug/metabolite transporter (DMT)-like permease